jgi:hypothetical protein
MESLTPKSGIREQPGSKCEELALSISCPLYPPLATEERTFGIGSSVP